MTSRPPKAHSQDARLIAELVDACEQAVRRIEKLNTGTEALGKDPTIEKLKRVLKKAKRGKTERT